MRFSSRMDCIRVVLCDVSRGGEVVSRKAHNLEAPVRFRAPQQCAIKIEQVGVVQW